MPAKNPPLDDLRGGWQTQIEFGLANPVLFRMLSDPDRVQNSVAAQSDPGHARRAAGSGPADAMFEAVLRDILTEGPDRAADGPLATAVAFRAISPQLDVLTDAERQVLAEWLDRAIAAL